MKRAIVDKRIFKGIELLNWTTYPDNLSADGTLSSLSTRKEARLNDKVGQGEERAVRN